MHRRMQRSEPIHRLRTGHCVAHPSPSTPIMQLEFKSLHEIDPAAYVALHTNPLVVKQLPLSQSDFDEAACREWITGKQRMWTEHGYGPWAFEVDGRFAGWGGLQPQDGETDLGLVLHPDFWGCGQAIYDEIIRRAFEEMGLPSVTILFPPSRIRIRGILHLGFAPDGEMEIEGQRFLRYRLHAPDVHSPNPRKRQRGGATDLTHASHRSVSSTPNV